MGGGVGNIRGRVTFSFTEKGPGKRGPLYKGFFLSKKGNPSYSIPADRERKGKCVPIARRQGGRKKKVKFLLCEGKGRF